MDAVTAPTTAIIPPIMMLVIRSSLELNSALRLRLSSRSRRPPSPRRLCAKATNLLAHIGAKAANLLARIGAKATNVFTHLCAEAANLFMHLCAEAANLFMHLRAEATNLFTHLNSETPDFFSKFSELGLVFLAMFGEALVQLVISALEPADTLFCGFGGHRWTSPAWEDRTTCNDIRLNSARLDAFCQAGRLISHARNSAVEGDYVLPSAGFG